MILSEGEEIESVNKYREPFAVGQLCSTIFIFFQRFLILTQRLQQFCVPFAKEKSGKFNKIYLHEKTTTQKVFNKSSRVIYDCRSNCKLAVTNYIHLEMVVFWFGLPGCFTPRLSLFSRVVLACSPCCQLGDVRTFLLVTLRP